MFGISGIATIAYGMQRGKTVKRILPTNFLVKSCLGANHISAQIGPIYIDDSQNIIISISIIIPPPSISLRPLLGT